MIAEQRNLTILNMGERNVANLQGQPLDRIFMSNIKVNCDSPLNHFAIPTSTTQPQNLNSRTMTYWAIDKISLLEPHAERVHRDYDKEHHVHTYHHHDNEEQQPVLERLQMHTVCGQSAPV